MNILKKIILILIGIILSLVVAEVTLQVKSPSILKTNKLGNINISFWDKHTFLKWAYFDIRKPFFKIKDNMFYIQRKDYHFPGIKTKKYDYIKTKKRIFILGESTAKFYSEKILHNILIKYFDCDVINCGMGAYDSYRIEKISKEIAKFNPDWVICFIGNNDKVIEDSTLLGWPASFEPIDINYLPYKYPIIKKFATLNLLSNIVCKEINPKTQDEIENFFKQNIIKIIKNLKNCKIIFIDLPNNENFYMYDTFENIITENDSNIKKWKDSNHYKILLKRLNFIESLQSKYNNVFYTNLTKTLLNYCDNELGYNILIDDCHWTKETYCLLSEIIAKIIVKQDFNKDLDLTISKEEFNEHLLKERCILSMNNSSVDYFIRNNFNNLYKDYLLQNKEYKKNLTNHDIYRKIFIYACSLYKNNYKDLALSILNELISLQANNIDAYLALGCIYYKEKDIQKSKKYFDIAKKIDSNNKIDIEYLKFLEEKK